LVAQKEQSQLQLGTENTNTIDSKGLFDIESSDAIVYDSEGKRVSMSFLIPTDRETPLQIMQRRYCLLDIDMSAGDEQTLNLYDLLGSKPLIQDVLSSFRYFRSDIEVDIQITGSPLLYGYLGVWTYPMKANLRDCYDPLLQFKTWSTFASLLSIADQESEHLFLPWPSPEVIGETVFSEDAYWQLVISNRSTRAMTSDTTEPTVRVQVMANFSSPEVAGPFSSDFGLEHHSFEGVLTGAAESVCTGMGLPSAICKPLGQFAGKQTLAAGTAAKEGVQGLFSDSSTADTFKDVESRAKTTTPGSLDQGNRSAVRQNFYGNMSDFNPGSSFESISDMPFSRVMDRRIMGLNDDSFDVSSLITKKAVIEEKDFVMGTTMATNTVVQYLVAPQVGEHWIGTDLQAQLYEPTFLAYCSQFYKYWRGGIDYEFQIYCPSLVSARFFWLISWERASGPFDPSAFMDVSGTMMSGIISARGTTTAHINIPYLRPHIFDKIGDVQDCPVLYFGILNNNPKATETTNIVIPVVVMKSASPDFEFSQFDGGSMHRKLEDDLEHHGKINDQSKQAKTTYPSRLLTLCNRMGRSYTTFFGFPGFNISGNTPASFTNSYCDASFLDKVSTLALYYSGSRAYKISFSATENYGFIGITYPITKDITTTQERSDYYHTEMGAVLVDQNTFRMAEVKVDFQSQFMCYFTVENPGFTQITEPLIPVLHSHLNMDQSPIPELVFSSARPDYNMYHLLPPPSRLLAYDITGADYDEDLEHHSYEMDEEGTRGRMSTSDAIDVMSAIVDAYNVSRLPSQPRKQVILVPSEEGYAVQIRDHRDQEGLEHHSSDPTVFSYPAISEGIHIGFYPTLDRTDLALSFIPDVFTGSIDLHILQASHEEIYNIPIATQIGITSTSTAVRLHLVTPLAASQPAEMWFESIGVATMFQPTFVFLSPSTSPEVVSNIPMVTINPNPGTQHYAIRSSRTAWGAHVGFRLTGTFPAITTLTIKATSWPVPQVFHIGSEAVTYTTAKLVFAFPVLNNEAVEYFYSNSNDNDMYDLVFSFGSSSTSYGDLPQPLWISNYRVSPTADGIDYPVQVSYFKNI